MVKEIPLQNGMVALVDDEDFERVSQYTWNCLVNKNSYLQIKGWVEGREIYLTRYITNCKPNEVVFYKDNNKLNNTKNNLIIGNKEVAWAEISVKRKAYSGGSSKYKGVHWCKRRNKWVSKININKKRYYIGYFSNEDEAAIAYNNFVNKNLEGRCAYLNIIGVDNRTVFKKNEKTKQHRSKSKIGYRGLNKSGRKYSAYITHNRQKKYLGVFDTPEEAAKAYDKKALELFGDKAILNFPESKELG